MRFGVSGISFRAVQTEPEIRLYIILRNSAPVHIEETQSIPSLACATQVWNVLCCFSIPFGSEPKALFNTFAVFVFLSQFDIKDSEPKDYIAELTVIDP